MKCANCLRGFSPCLNPVPCTNTATVEVIEEEIEDKRSRSHKRDTGLRDQQSTGRKRAAVMYPLDREALCEWNDASPTNPKGGGKYPMTIGCILKQQARHHGPDKNTLNNEIGNVHRICHFHHNNWHAKNDPEYDPNQPHRGD